MSVDTLPEGQQELAFKLASQMSETFELDYDLFAVVHTDPGSFLRSSTVAYCGRLGLIEGNWNDIVGTTRSPVPKEDYVVEVDGVEYDTRKGMTEGVYRAIVAQDPNNFCPDSPIFGMTRSRISFPHTWLTGESATPQRAPAAMVNIRGGRTEVDRLGMRRNTQNDMVRFRPAVTLGQVAIAS
jgi:hypothetical protein